MKTVPTLLASIISPINHYFAMSDARPFTVGTGRRQKGWSSLRKSVCLLLLAVGIAVPLIIVRQVLAVEVEIDDLPWGADGDSHNGSSPTLVFTSDLTGYAFYRTVSGNCSYSKTTNGGSSWGSPVTVDTQTDCIKIAVWYDQWTPGDAGTNIHIVTVDSGDDELFYTRLNTSGDGLTSTVSATNNTRTGTFDDGVSIPSITKATNGHLYMGIQDLSDSFVIKCTGTCESTAWTIAGITNPFDLANDWLILMPLSGASANNILAIRWDLSADDIQSKVYTNASNTWDASWTNIDTSAPANATYDAPFGATLNKASGTIYLAYAAQNDSLNDGDDDVRTATYIAATWNPLTADVLTNTSRGVVGVKIAVKQDTDAVYVVYTVRNTSLVPNSAGIHWKVSPDGMATWGSEQAALNTLTNTDIYGARVNIMSANRICATWIDLTNADFLGNCFADFPVTAVEMADFTAKNAKKGVLLEWRTGYEVDNLGFNIYREKDGKRLRVNPSILAGSAFLTGPGTTMTAGDSYSWSDPKGSADSVYYLEDLALDGTSTMHGPVTPSGSARESSASSKSKRAALLSEVNDKAREKTRGQQSQRGWATPTLLTDIDVMTSQQGPIATFQEDSSAVTGIGSELKVLPGPGSRRSSDLFPAAATNSMQSEGWQRTLAGLPGLKLAVREAGWYRVSQPELVAAGLKKNADPRYLQLYADGVEVPIRINSTRTSGSLKPGYSIEFYGVGLNTPSTDTRDYWLISGVTEGKRINPLIMKPVISNGALQSFNYTVEHKERFIYFSGLLNGDDENFFGQVVGTAPISQTLSVQNLFSNSIESPRLEVALQGMTLQDHVVRVQLNGTEVGVLSFGGRERKVARFTFDRQLLVQGDNTVTLERMNGDMDISLVDYLRLTYARSYQADNDYLQFTLNGRAQVSGFSVPDVMLLDVTDPNSVRLYNPKAEADAGGYRFTVATSQPRTFLALTNQEVGQVSKITANKPSNWGLKVNGADFVVITHRNFRDSVEPLAQLRRNQGMSVAVIDVEDVYDEFSYGAHSPHAIREFLKWAATNWLVAPRFVLLAGDGSYDPRNYLGGGDTDLVPARLIDTALLETASDDWFVDFNDDGIAEMAIGRLPVRTAAEANIMISKIVNYSPANPVQNVLMVADKMDTKTNFNFEAASNQLSALLPATIGVQKIFRGDNAPSVVHDQIVSGINQGPLLVNFLGHGSVEVWTGAPILSTLDAATFNNGPRLPVFFTMTCLNGYYQNPARESMAESFLRTGTGGAVAVWASSGMTSPEPQFQMNSALYEQLFGNQPLTLGEAIRNAKAASGDRDVLRTWILFGDPTMKLR